MSCVILRHRKIGGGKPAALIFASGYMSVNGSSSVHEAKTNVRKFARLIQRNGYDVRLNKISVQSVSAACQLRRHKKFNLLKDALHLKGQYEPELFSAMCVRQKGICCLIFNNGKVVITGIKEKDLHSGTVTEVLRNITSTLAAV